LSIYMASLTAVSPQRCLKAVTKIVSS